MIDTNDKLCQTCKHYVPEEKANGTPEFGECTLAENGRWSNGRKMDPDHHQDDRVMFFAQDADCLAAWLNVRPTFGCIMHEVRD